MLELISKFFPSESLTITIPYFYAISNVYWAIAAIVFLFIWFLMVKSDHGTIIGAPLLSVVSSAIQSAILACAWGIIVIVIIGALILEFIEYETGSILIKIKEKS